MTDANEGKRPRGRARRAHAESLTASLSVLLTEAQRDALYEEAYAAGFLSVSEYVRQRKLGLSDARAPKVASADAGPDTPDTEEMTDAHTDQ